MKASIGYYFCDCMKKNKHLAGLLATEVGEDERCLHCGCYAFYSRTKDLAKTYYKDITEDPKHPVSDMDLEYFIIREREFLRHRPPKKDREDTKAKYFALSQPVNKDEVFARIYKGDTIGCIAKDLGIQPKYIWRLIHDDKIRSAKRVLAA